MVTREDVESYLLRLDQESEELEPGMWIVQNSHHDVRMVIHHTPPLLLLRMKVMELPNAGTDCTDLYRRLLELNAVDVVHGAYGIEDGDVILSDTLELENLDFNEFQASVDSMQVALASHLESLSAFRAC
ncbi:hypothetical protein BH23GEM8_BH23GEM8_07770 [soil metagenome]